MTTPPAPITTGGYPVQGSPYANQDEGQLYQQAPGVLPGAALQYMNPMMPWGGPMTAGINPYQTMGLNLGITGATKQMQDLAALYPAGFNALGAFNESMNMADNPYLDEYVQRMSQNMAQNFGEQVLPQIDTSATQAGQFGGSRHGIATGLAAQGLSDTIGDMTQKTYYDAWSNQLADRARMLGLAPTLQGLISAPSMGLANLGQTIGQAGDFYRGIANEQLRGAQNQWNAFQQFPWQQLQNYNAIVQPGAALGGSQTTDQGGTSPLAGAVGGGLMGMGLTQSPFFSAGGAGAGIGGALGGWALPALGGLLGGLA